MDDWRVVFQSPNRAACADRAFVLTSVGIPHQVITDESGSAILVPAEHSGRAVHELSLYDEENPPVMPAKPPTYDYLDPVPGVITYLVIIVGVAWLAANAALGENWLQAGRMDGSLLRDGQLWRSFTALTLHSGLEHLAGNIVFGALFGSFAGRFAGSGVAWLAILLAAALGNSVNTLLLDETHRSIGASTAVFAALGLSAGFSWRAKLVSQERWIYRIGPIVGGLALLMYTGTGDAQTDIGAHLMGFAAGFGAGVLLTKYQGLLQDMNNQRLAGVAAVGCLLIAWVFALTV